MIKSKGPPLEFLAAAVVAVAAAVVAVGSTPCTLLLLLLLLLLGGPPLVLCFFKDLNPLKPLNKSLFINSASSPQTFTEKVLRAASNAARCLSTAYITGLIILLLRGRPPVDAGGPPVDAGGPPEDAGGPPVDGGGPWGPPACAEYCLNNEERNALTQPLPHLQKEINKRNN